MKKEICCVVLNYNDSKMTTHFTENMLENEAVEHIVIVDNRSTDNSYKILRKKFQNNNNVHVICTDKNGGYGYGNNFGIRYCFEKFKPGYIIISNPDVEVNNQTIINLSDALSNNSKAIIAAPKMIQKGGKAGNAPWRIPSTLEYVFLSSFLFGTTKFKISYENLLKEVEKVDCVSGAFLMIAAKPEIEKGVYDEAIFLYCEETCIGIKCKNLGFETLFLPHSTYTHIGSHSINQSTKSEIDRLKITLKSRCHVLKQYYKVNDIGMAVIKLLFKVQILENYVLIKLLKVKRMVKK